VKVHVCACICVRAGIEEQISRLSEIEELEAEWRAQAAAQDEVEKMLKAI
jgi:hypothetical protein